MLRLLRRSNSNRSNCSADTVVIPNVNLRQRGDGETNDACCTTITNNGAAAAASTVVVVTNGGSTPVNGNSNSSSSSTAAAVANNNRSSMVAAESCTPTTANTRAKDVEQHRRYRPHSQARRLRKTQQVSAVVVL